MLSTQCSNKSNRTRSNKKSIQVKQWERSSLDLFFQKKLFFLGPKKFQRDKRRKKINRQNRWESSILHRKIRTRFQRALILVKLVFYKSAKLGDRRRYLICTFLMSSAVSGYNYHFGQWLWHPGNLGCQPTYSEVVESKLSWCWAFFLLLFFPTFFHNRASTWSGNARWCNSTHDVKS